jgi:DNA (cytosine-5)-methyltransferase 1
VKKSYPTVTDMFCGAGGSSQGAMRGGCNVVMAMNHWPLAVETHNTNFPNTDHDCADISGSDPRRYPSTDLLICSPECTNHSLSKGKKRKNLGQLDLFNPQVIDPAEERSRATMWDVVRFAEYHQYNLIIVENVVEVRYWMLFDAWLKAMAAMDYDHEEVYFNSMFAPPTPQSRDRIYIVFWKRSNRKPNLNFTPLAHCAEHGDVQAIQSWKDPHKRWGRYGKRNQYVYRCPQCAAIVEPYYAPAHTAIDWSLPSQKVGDRKRPLKPATLERIEKGLEKFGMPLVIETAHTKSTANHARHVDKILPTQTTAQTLALATPYMVILRKSHGARAMTDPLDTFVAGGTHHGLVQPFLTSYYSGSDQVSGVDAAVPTVTTGDRHALVQPFLAEPFATVTVEDCYFRMLQPCEIKRAMAFNDDYVVLGNKREQVKLCGNAVTPPVMEILIQRCIATLGGT